MLPRSKQIFSPDQIRISRVLDEWVTSTEARQDQVMRMSLHKLAALLLTMVQEIREDKKS